ncbi:GNAT family N-acetyltransferase [Rhodanobacter ginsengiterrae]|uniref:GNAT family N-acetyltransferase n=1 Tax=Rhodanobacter ginsengiterrae TaxID=2008451 RepID=UPI003CF7C7EA
MQKLPSSDYTVVDVEEADIVARVAGIFTKNGNAKAESHLRWQYLEPPAGSAYTAIAVAHNNDDAAIYSVFKVKGIEHGTEAVFCQSLDTLTDKEHRGQGLFPKIAKAVFERCDKDSVRFIYGFPNSSSAPGFFGKLGWKDLGHPPFKAHLSNLLFPFNYALALKGWCLKNYPARKLLKLSIARNSEALGATVVDTCGFELDEYESIWRAFAQDLKVCVARDREYMLWRYKQKASADYKYVSVFGGSGNLLGAAVYTLQAKHRGKIGYVMDIVCDPKDVRVSRLLIASVVSRLYDLGADMILAWSADSSPLDTAYRRGLFFKLPRFLQPIKLHFGYRPNKDAPKLIEAEDFFISYADSDTV